jgi:hypothetical protein
MDREQYVGLEELLAMAVIKGSKKVEKEKAQRIGKLVKENFLGVKNDPNFVGSIVASRGL